MIKKSFYLKISKIDCSNPFTDASLESSDPSGVKKLIVIVVTCSSPSLYFIHVTPFFFIRTPNFLPRLDVLIFLAISASDVLIHVLNF